MTLHQSEAIVLRTWPLRESDLLVSLLTRDLGKVRGVAKAALKSRKRFGGTLEPMTYVHAAYAERPRQELVRLDHFESDRVAAGRSNRLSACSRRWVITQRCWRTCCPTMIRRMQSFA